MKHVRIEHDGQAIDATLEATPSGPTALEIDITEVERWLSPVTPSKIIATHLTYRSRAEEYRMARAARASRRTS